MTTLAKREVTVDEALKAVREIVGPYPQIIVNIRDCGQETRSQHGRIEYGAQIGMNGQEYTGPTVAKVLAQVRAWKDRNND